MKKILILLLAAFTLGIFLPSLEAQPATGQPVTSVKFHKKHRKHHRPRHHHPHRHHKIVILK
jgi:hypothetical protein